MFVSKGICTLRSKATYHKHCLRQPTACTITSNLWSLSIQFYVQFGMSGWSLSALTPYSNNNSSLQVCSLQMLDMKCDIIYNHPRSPQSTTVLVALCMITRIVKVLRKTENFSTHGIFFINPDFCKKCYNRKFHPASHNFFQRNPVLWFECQPLTGNW